MGVGPGTYRGEAGLEGGDDAGGGLGLVANLLDEGVLHKTKISSISGDSQKIKQFDCHSSIPSTLSPPHSPAT